MASTSLHNVGLSLLKVLKFTSLTRRSQRSRSKSPYNRTKSHDLDTDTEGQTHSSCKRSKSHDPDHDIKVRDGKVEEKSFERVVKNNSEEHAEGLPEELCDEDVNGHHEEVLINILVQNISWVSWNFV